MPGIVNLDSKDQLQDILHDLRQGGRLNRARLHTSQVKESSRGKIIKTLCSDFGDNISLEEMNIFFQKLPVEYLLMSYEGNSFLKWAVQHKYGGLLQVWLNDYRKVPGNYIQLLKDALVTAIEVGEIKIANLILQHASDINQSLETYLVPAAILAGGDRSAFGFVGELSRIRNIDVNETARLLRQSPDVIDTLLSHGRLSQIVFTHELLQSEEMAGFVFTIRQAIQLEGIAQGLGEIAMQRRGTLPMIAYGIYMLDVSMVWKAFWPTVEVRSEESSEPIRLASIDFRGVKILQPLPEGETIGLLPNMVDLATTGLRFSYKGKKVEILYEYFDPKNKKAGKKLSKLKTLLDKANPGFFAKWDVAGLKPILDKYHALCQKSPRNFDEIAAFLCNAHDPNNIAYILQALDIQAYAVKLGKQFSNDAQAFRDRSFTTLSEAMEIDIRFNEILNGLRARECVLNGGMIRILGSSMQKHPDCYINGDLPIDTDGNISAHVLYYLANLQRDDNFGLAFYPLILLSNVDVLFSLLRDAIGDMDLSPQNASMFVATGGSNPGFGIHYHKKNYVVEFNSFRDEVKIEGMSVQDYFNDETIQVAHTASDMAYVLKEKLAKLRLTPQNSAQLLNQKQHAPNRFVKVVDSHFVNIIKPAPAARNVHSRVDMTQTSDPFLRT